MHRRVSSGRSNARINSAAQTARRMARMQIPGERLLREAARTHKTKATGAGVRAASGQPPALTSGVGSEF